MKIKHTHVCDGDFCEWPQYVVAVLQCLKEKVIDQNEARKLLFDE